MKKFNIYILAIAMLALGSCTKDYLDTEPKTELTTDNFYKTPSDAFDALVGCYDGLQIAVGASEMTFPVASEVLSDDCFGGTGNSDDYKYQMLDEFNVSRSPSSINVFNDTWVKYYQAIFRCNALLEKMDQVEWGADQGLKTTYESEARFIRAYLYFDMVRLFGPVPLLTEPSEDIIPRFEVKEVYKVIAEDLSFAATEMNDVAYTELPSGRVTKWAAKSLLARVYLYYTGYYGASDLAGVVNQSTALAHIEDVIAQSGHGLVEDFRTLWPAASVDDFAGEDNKEIVFSVKFTYTSDYDGNTDGNHWMVMFGMREFDHLPYGKGWGITVNPELYNLYKEGDSRRDATVIAIDEEEIPFNKHDGQREYTGYYNKKYAPMTALDQDGKLGSIAEQLGGTNFQIGQFQDYYAIRYSDVLLMAAELGSASGQQYFDQVRQRALGTDFVALTANPSNIFNERHMEFAMEGIRYWDLLRQGIGTASAALAKSVTLPNGGVPTSKVISAGNVQSTMGLQQIPNTQITLSNNVVTQNNGW